MTGEVYLCVISCYTKYESKTYRLFMRRNLVGIIVLILLSVRVVNAQTVADSIAIVTAPWEVVTVENGIVHKRASIPFLYQGAQSINILEINPRTGKKIGIAFTGQLEKISRIARKHQAIGAINGSYFDMTKGNSVCFLKVGSQVVDTTSLDELKLRVTGAVYEKKGKVKLIPWDRQIEKNYKKNKGSVLASGPLMLKDGEYYDWRRKDSVCYCRWAISGKCCRNQHSGTGTSASCIGWKRCAESGWRRFYRLMAVRCTGRGNCELSL